MRLHKNQRFFQFLCELDRLTARKCLTNSVCVPHFNNWLVRDLCPHMCVLWQEQIVFSVKGSLTLRQCLANLVCALYFSSLLLNALFSQNGKNVISV